MHILSHISTNKYLEIKSQHLRKHVITIQIIFKIISVTLLMKCESLEYMRIMLVMMQYSYFLGTNHLITSYETPSDQNVNTKFD